MTKEEKTAHQLFICGRSMKRDAEGWVWQRGKAKEVMADSVSARSFLVDVTITPSESGGEGVDFHVTVCVAGALVFEDWKATEERAATWATKKLHALFNAIGGAR